MYILPNVHGVSHCLKESMKTQNRACEEADPTVMKMESQMSSGKMCNCVCLQPRLITLAHRLSDIIDAETSRMTPVRRSAEEEQQLSITYVFML